MHKLYVQTTHFTLIKDLLYRRSFREPHLRCLSKLEAKYVLAELYESVYRNHPGERTLAHHAYMQGYYWPTMKQNAENYVKRCDWCQRHAPIPHVPFEALNPVTSPWPFAQWGIDIICPLPVAITQKKFLLIAIDYFSKWVETKAILMDNGPQFDSTVFRTVCSKLNIKNLYSTP